MWKYDSLYRLLSDHPRFEPLIVLNPSYGKSKEVNDGEILEMKAAFQERGYRVHPEICYSHSLELPKGVKADIVFSTQPYVLFPRDFNAYKYIHLYVPYYFSSQDHARWMYDSFLQNICWKIFFPTKATVKIARELMSSNRESCVSVGYPIFDDIQLEKRNHSSPWKPYREGAKRVIWAPHFSINPGAIFKVSNFLSLSGVMLELVNKYRDCIQFAFKPHPFLFQSLCSHPDWGVEKARNYYKTWEEMENSQRAEGDYKGLFVGSDAIIHDCHSFTVEYLYTKNPGMYLTCSDSSHRPDSVGVDALNAYYHGSSRRDIEDFIESVVLGGNDPKKEARERFYDKYLLPPNGQGVAQNILDEIERGLGWK